MANPIIQAVYDLKDNITGKLKIIADGLRSNQSQSDKFAAGAERNNKRVSDSYAKTADGIGRLRSALVAVAGLVGLVKLKDALLDVVNTGDKFELLSKRFEVVFGSVDAGSAAFEKIKDIAKSTPQTLDEVATAAVKLKAFGLDPLDGTLVGLIDQNAKLGGSNEDLQNTILALGQAWTKQKLQGDDIRQLLEKGIPVYDLLAQATGRTAKEIQHLSEEGQLGRESIRQLIDQIGKSAAGGAAAQMKTLTGLVSNLKDTFDEFLVRIANAGTLDFLKGKLTELGAAISDLSSTGRLQEIATSISDGIVSTAKGVESAIKFVADYSGALLELGKTYIIFRGINFAGSILDGASAMLSAAKAAKVAAVEGAATAGAFGKLRTAAKSIPANIKIAVAAAAIDFTLGKLANLKAGLEELRETNKRSDQIDTDRIETQRKLAERVAAVKEQYVGFASVALETGDQLRAQNAEQLQAYGKQLEGAKTFYNALVVEARNAGDAAGLAGAKEKLAQVNAQIAAVNAQLVATRAVGSAAAGGLTEGATKVAATLSQVGTNAKSAGEEIQKAFDGFDISKDIIAVGDFALGFDAVAAKGGKTGKLLDATLLESIKKLSGEDLLKFQSSAIAAMDSVGGAGAKTSATIKATLEAGLERLGVKAEDTGVKITKTGADTIATFTAVAENVQATAKTIEAAFDAALAGAKTVDEAKALGAALQAAFATGKVGAKELADATRDLDERIRTITASISPLASQFELLGIKSQAQLNAVRDNAAEAFDAIVKGAHEGTAAQEDVVRAFKVYVEAARAAAADGTATAKQQVEDQLAIKASVLGLSDSFVKLGDEGKKAGDATAAGFDNAKDAIGGASDELQRFGVDTSAAAIASDRIGESARNNATAMGDVIALTVEQRRALQELNETLARGNGIQDLSLSSAKSLLTELGAAAGAQTQLLVARINELEQAAQRTEQATQRLKDQADSVQDEIDQLEGNQADIEDRRHAKRLADLKEEADADGTANTAAYRQLVDLENKLHDLKLRNQKTETGGGGSGSGSNRSGGGLGSGSPDGGDPTGSAPPPSGPQPSPRPSPNQRQAPQLNFAPNIILLTGDARAVDQLGRALYPVIQNIMRRS